MPSSSSSRRLFALSPDQLGAAQTWTEHGERTPREPRPAASVVLLRDAPGGVETYLGYRRGDSPLGTVAFPGGSVEASDDDALTWFGPTPVQWARALDMAEPLQARRCVLAAVRELFEETGILLAGPDASTLLEGTSTEEWMRVREHIAGQEESFAGMLSRRGLGVRTDLIKPLARWISPDFAHRRFDTHYFAAVQPISQQPVPLQSKELWAKWCQAAELVAGREGTGLGDEIGRPDTVGRTFGQLTVPAVQIMVEKMAAARGCIAFLSHKRIMATYRPELVNRDGQYMLEVELPTASEGGQQRGR